MSIASSGREKGDSAARVCALSSVEWGFGTDPPRNTSSWRLTAPSGSYLRVAHTVASTLEFLL